MIPPSVGHGSEFRVPRSHLVRVQWEVVAPDAPCREVINLSLIAQHNALPPHNAACAYPQQARVIDFALGHLKNDLSPIIMHQLGLSTLRFSRG